MGILNQLVLLSTVILLSLTIAHSAHVNFESTTQKTSTEFCTYSLACGWMVYNPTTKKVQHVIKNFCECPQHTRCVKTYYETSNSADVFNCRDEIKAQGKDPWPSDEFFTGLRSTSPGKFQFQTTA